MNASKSISPASSSSAKSALETVTALQKYFAAQLATVTTVEDDHPVDPFTAFEWLRDAGRHGGGMRLSTVGHPFFNAASINVSQVHYEDDPSKQLSSATAISTIIHPAHPRCPSVHMHISWTELKQRPGYWRMMADLNPAIPQAEWTELFNRALKDAIPKHFDVGTKQGNQYFYIPALKRHRGVSHFYLESFSTGRFEDDRALADRFGHAMIDAYITILGRFQSHAPAISGTDRRAQLDYHTLYFFQVLTLDRGTTSGLLVHDQNDVGILGSLPRFIDRALLESWQEKVSDAQKKLLSMIINHLPPKNPAPIDDETKIRIAAGLREFYRNNPSAQDALARGNVIPPTTQNHR